MKLHGQFCSQPYLQHKSTGIVALPNLVGAVPGTPPDRDHWVLQPSQVLSLHILALVSASRFWGLPQSWSASRHPTYMLKGAAAMFSLV